MATAISASYMNIPLAHIQGGEVTGNIDEKVRHAITKLADYHFVASESAKQRVIKLGENFEMVFNTGCPSIDIASEVEKRNVQLSLEDYRKSKKLDSAFVRKMSEVVNKSFHAWIQARKENDFRVFEKPLHEVI